MVFEKKIFVDLSQGRDHLSELRYSWRSAWGIDVYCCGTATSHTAPRFISISFLEQRSCSELIVCRSMHSYELHQ